MKKITWERYKALEDRAAATAWKRAGAYLVFRGADLVARVRFAYPADGAGPLKAFVVDLSQSTSIEDPMACRHYRTANGGGYDKASAAMSGAVIAGVTLRNDGYDWKHQLEAAGLAVHWAL
jgi:hypothetical protein